MTSKVKNSGVSNVIKLIKKALNHHFGYPVLMNWGYPVMYMSVGLALIFCITEQQTTGAHIDAILLISGIFPIPEHFGHYPEHGATIEAKASQL